MFEPESIQTYKLCHIQKSRIGIPLVDCVKSYSFLVRHKHGRSKYIVQLHCFTDQMIVSYYKKVKYVKKEKFRVIVNDNSFGKVGVTVLAIVADNIKKDGYKGFGFIGASRPNEKTERLTLRYRVYTEIIRRKIATENFVLVANDHSSTIFVLSKNFDKTRKANIIKRYNGIFRELYKHQK